MISNTHTHTYILHYLMIYSPSPNRLTNRCMLWSRGERLPNMSKGYRDETRDVPCIAVLIEKFKKCAARVLVLAIFQLEISDPAEAEALVSQNLVCQVTGIVYKVYKNFDRQFRLCSATTVNVSGTRQKHVDLSKNVSSEVRIILLKNARVENQENQRVQTVI